MWLHIHVHGAVENIITKRYLFAWTAWAGHGRHGRGMGGAWAAETHVYRECVPLLHTVKKWGCEVQIYAICIGLYHA